MDEENNHNLELMIQDVDAFEMDAFDYNMDNQRLENMADNEDDFSSFDNFGSGSGSNDHEQTVPS